MLAFARRVSFGWLLLLALPVLFSLPVRAQTPTPTPKGPVQMALSSPFAFTAQPLSLMVKLGRWFPVAVTLSNTGDPVSGRVTLQLVANGEFDSPPNTFYCDVDLPSNSHKVVWLYGRLERPNVSAVDISFSGRGISVPTARVPVQEPESWQRIVLTISDADNSVTDALKSLTGDGISTGTRPPNSSQTGSQGPLRALQAAPIDVPDRWFGLEMADLLVLGDFPHVALAPAQLDAMRGFVQGGGNLLAMGGANAPRLSSSPLADLWPVSVGNSITANAGQVGDIVSRYVASPRNGADRLGGAPVVLARATLKAGAELRDGNAGAPLFCTQNQGAGRVLFLGYDPSQPPFNGWSGQNSLWREVFGTTARARRLDNIDTDFVPDFASYNGSYPGGYPGSYEGNQNTTITDQLLGSLAKAPQLTMPPVSQIAWFLSLYVFVLVPLNYTVLRFFDRRELAWVTIPVIVAAFSLFAYAAALSIRGTAILTRQVDIVQSSLGSRTARVDSLLWLFSPRRTTYDVVSSENNAAVADYVNTAGTKQGSFLIAQTPATPSFKAEGANIWMWTDRAFSSQCVTDLKGGIALNGNRLQNLTPYDLTGAVWVQDRDIRVLTNSKHKTLAKGASVVIPQRATATLNGTDLAGAVANNTHPEWLFETAIIHNGITNNALRVALGDALGRQNNGACLVAWAKTPVTPLSFGVNGARSKNVTLFVFRAPTLPDSRLGMREAVVRQVSFSADAPDSAAGYECSLAAAPHWNLEAHGLISRQMAPPSSRQKATATPIQIEVWDMRLKRWSLLKGRVRRDKSPDNGWTFSAVISPDYVRQPDRLLKVRVGGKARGVHVSSLRVSA